jgi:hypothetical protein
MEERSLLHRRIIIARSVERWSIFGEIFSLFSHVGEPFLITPLWERITKNSILLGKISKTLKNM